MRPYLRIIALISFCWMLVSCGVSTDPGGQELRLRPVSYASLSGWSRDSHAVALQTFLKSCTSINRRAAGDWFGPSRAFGRVGRWQRACRSAATVGSSDAAAKVFFERTFQPHAVAGRGTFTGYYEVAVRGSRWRSAANPFPVYGRPSDLGSRSPYYTRAQIDAGALAGRGLELFYLSSAADAFLLHVQGSGAIQLSDGSWVRISYAANNGHRFKSISSALAAAGYDTSVEGGTMIDYRRWLNQNPQKAVGVIQANPRYIFFGQHNQNGPIGAQGIALTPGRSMAVDRDYIGLGTPIFLNTQYPDPNQNNARRPLRRLVVAQDTGAAINGPVRGDFYWGTGETALLYAGGMKQEGSYTLLLPK